MASRLAHRSSSNSALAGEDLTGSRVAAPRLDEDALQLVHLYFERGSPKYEKAALRWLERYLTEGSPRLQHFADVTASLASRESQVR